jgi:hypothetical protein
MYRSTEVLLSVLVKNFEFSLSDNDEDIFWETASISSPVLLSVDGVKTHQLPLVVTAIKSN